MGRVEAGVPGGPAVTGETLDAVAGERVQYPLAVDPPDPLAVVVHHQEVSPRVAHDPHGPTRVGNGGFGSRLPTHSGDGGHVTGGKVL